MLVGLAIVPAGFGDDRLKSPELSTIQPPGGPPLRTGERGAEISVSYVKKAGARLEAAGAEMLDKWVAELERIMEKKLDGELAKQACRTYFVTHMSVAFNDLKWNATVATKLFRRAQSMPASEAKAWKEALAALLKKEIGQDANTNQPGGPAYAVPLVLIPVDAVHEAERYSVERGKKYLSRLKQLTADDLALWKEKVDRYGGTDLDAAVNIILLDDFFDRENFRREVFRSAVESGKK
jgi:hypothetical protein